jgi:hypothetical protein
LARSCEPADLIQLVRTFVDLAVELGHLGMAGVGRQRGRHSIHADVTVLETIEDRPQALKRDPQVRLRLPAPRVVRGKPAIAEDLHREAETVPGHDVPAPKTDAVWAVAATSARR